MKLIAKTTTLVDDAEKIAAYIKYHDEIWPEVVGSFKQIGVLDIKIWKSGLRLFLLMAVEDNFDPERDFGTYLTLNPRNSVWEELMATFQVPDPEALPGEKWTEMDLIFQL